MVKLSCNSKIRVSILTLIFLTLMMSCGGSSKESQTSESSSQTENSSTSSESEYNLEADYNRCNDKEVARLAKDISQACSDGDFTKAHSLLDILHSEYVRELGHCNLNDDVLSHIPTCRPTYISSRDLVFKNEMMMMAKSGDSSDITYLLLDMPFDMPEPQEGEVSYYYASSNTALKMYIEDVDNFNRKCDNIISLAISEGNKELANKALGLYKPKYYAKTGESDGKVFTLENGKTVKLDGNHGYVYYTNKPHEDALKRIKASF